MSLIDKTYSFYCNDLNVGKHDLLYKKALALRDFRNGISKEICKKFVFYINKSKYDWINLFRTKIEYCNNQDISNSIEQVYVSYKNKQEAFIKNTKTQIQKELQISHYKNTTEKHKKGEVKCFECKFKTTKLTSAVTYLSRYYNEGLIDYIRKNKSEEPNVQRIRSEVLYYIDKFGDRIINLAKQKQENIVKKLTEFPIEFEKLTFTSCTEQKQNIISKNKRTTSKYNAYITLSGQKTDGGKISIPVKFSQKHHGSVKEYYKQPNKKGQIQVSYTVIFEKGKLRIALTRKMPDETVAFKTNYYGIDTNVKHNLFCDKYGNTIDFDRSIFNDYVAFLKKCDEKLSNKPKKKRKLSNRDKIKKEHWMNRIEDMLKRKANLLVKQALSLGKDHIVMEDLGQMAKSFLKSEELAGFKYSRLIRLLNLANLKHIVLSIANKKGLQVTFIQPHYTSKGCKCGHIDDNNRKTQELFKCVKCGVSAPADTHSANMIEDRLTLDVLRQSLLDCKNGVYTPKKLSKNSIKNILIECYDIDAPVKVCDSQ